MAGAPFCLLKFIPMCYIIPVEHCASRGCGSPPGLQKKEDHPSGRSSFLPQKPIVAGSCYVYIKGSRVNWAAHDVHIGHKESKFQEYLKSEGRLGPFCFAYTARGSCVLDPLDDGLDDFILLLWCGIPVFQDRNGIL